MHLSPAQPERKADEIFPRPFFLALFIALALVGCAAYIHLQPWNHSDWDHYYGTSWLITHGIEPYGEKFASYPALQSFDQDPLKTIGQPTNPPPLATFLSPLGWLSSKWSWCLWTALSCLTLAFGLAWAGQIIGLWAIPKAPHFFLLALPLSYPLTEGLSYSQIAPVLGGLMLIAWIAHWQKRDALCAVLLSCCILFKIYPWPLAYLLFCGRWKIRCLSALASSAVLLLLPLMVIGTGSYQAWLEKAYPLIHHWELHGSSNLSLTHLLTPLLGTVPSTIFCLLLPAAAAVGAWRLCLSPVSSPSEQFHGFAWTATLGALCAPVAWSHYFIVVLPVLMVAVLRSNPVGKMFLAFVWLAGLSLLTLHFLKLPPPEIYSAVSLAVLYLTLLLLFLIPIFFPKKI